MKFIIGCASIALMALVGIIWYIIDRYKGKSTSEKETSNFVYFLLMFLAFTYLTCKFTYDYYQPHNNQKPTFQNLYEGEAHVDTVYTLCGLDTIKTEYILHWND